MSYVRWSDESDVYVYSSYGGREGYGRTHEVLVCCGCLFVKPNEPNNRFPGEHDHRIYEKPARQPHKYQKVMLEEMIQHLEEHRKVGHKVPQYAIENLRRDLG